MKEYPVTKYKGFSFKPIVKLSETKIDTENDWYEYSIQGWVKKRSRIIRGAGVYENAEGAAKAASSFARQEIDKHLTKYECSIFYRIFCSIGYCPASKYS